MAANRPRNSLTEAISRRVTDLRARAHVSRIYPPAERCNKARGIRAVYEPLMRERAKLIKSRATRDLLGTSPRLSNFGTGPKKREETRRASRLRTLS